MGSREGREVERMEERKKQQLEVCMPLRDSGTHIFENDWLFMILLW